MSIFGHTKGLKSTYNDHRICACTKITMPFIDLLHRLDRSTDFYCKMLAHYNKNVILVRT